MKPRIFGMLLGLAVSQAWADSDSSSAHEAGAVTFSGEISRGASFEKKLWNDLLFVLKANDTGWDISVTGGDAGADFVWVVTPPYRFDNPRYVGTVYGHSAVDAVAWTPRGFSFVVDQANYATAADAMRKILWPSGTSDSEIRTAEKVLSRMPRANGLLKIKRAKLSGTDGASAARIESLTFEVEIRPPMDLQAQGCDL